MSSIDPAPGSLTVQTATIFGLRLIQIKVLRRIVELHTNLADYNNSRGESTCDHVERGR